MRCRLEALGNDLALVLDEELVAELGYQAADEVEIATDGVRLYVFPAADDAAFKEVADKALAQYGTVLQRIAD